MLKLCEKTDFTNSFSWDCLPLCMNSGGVLDDLDHSFKLFAWDGRGKAWDLAQISLWNFNKWHPSLQMTNGEKLGIWNNFRSRSKNKHLRDNSSELNRFAQIVSKCPLFQHFSFAMNNATCWSFTNWFVLNLKPCRDHLKQKLKRVV